MASNAFKGRQPARRQATIKLKTLNRPTASDLIALFGKKRGLLKTKLFANSDTYETCNANIIQIMPR